MRELRERRSGAFSPKLETKYMEKGRGLRTTKFRPRKRNELKKLYWTCFLLALP
jgi:hypothetical protein